MRSNAPLRTVELYIGAPIELRSEREVVRLIIDALEDGGVAAQVFCNFHVSGRQLDLMVATARATLVFEVKTFAGRVRGRQNGEWQRLDAGGGRRLGNPYRQVVDAKHALRDAMRACGGEVAGYPGAYIVVAPRLPSGSDVDVDDHKARLIDAEDIPTILHTPSQACWSPHQWRALADHLGLRKVPNLDAAWSPALIRAEDLVERYANTFSALYLPPAASLLTDTYALDGVAIDTPTYVDHVVSTRRHSRVFGPSGCGKSLLAARVALAWQDGDGVSILLAAKYFETGFRQLLDRELGLLGTSAAALLNAVRRLAIPLLVVVDGYNEVAASRRLALTRSLRAIACRYNATVLVTTQGDIERPDLLGLAAVSVSEPSVALKRQIAGIAEDDPSDEAITSLLACVSSGLEARLLGEIGASLGVNPSGPVLFESYVRRTLGDAATQGIAWLARVSAELTRRLTFSLSVMELERLANESKVPAEVYRQVNESHILVRHGGRVGFWHELFLAAFAAEAAVRHACGNVGALLQAINDPRYADSRRFIIAAIDDAPLLDAVLKQVTQVDLLVASHEGLCGRKAQLCVQRHLDDLWRNALDEAGNLKFEITDSAPPHLAIVDGTVRDWTASDYARLEVLGRAFSDGARLDRLMEAAACLDASLARSAMALRELARQREVPLRTRLFELAYVRQSSLAMLPRLFALVASGIYRIRRTSWLATDAGVVDAWNNAVSPGQWYVLLSLARWMPDAQQLLPFVLPLFGDAWRYHPYHARLELIEFAHVVSRYEVDEPWRSQLIAAMEGVLETVHPLLAGTVLEVLQQLGALADDEAAHAQVVREELRELLSLPSDDIVNARARAVFDAQFDHPYAAAYSEVIEQLTVDERKRLWMRACEGTEYAGFFLAGLIQALVATGDPVVAQALGKWANLPEVPSFMPQEALRVYVLTHVGLGTLGVPLPARPETALSPAQRALRICAELCYWRARRDLADSQTRPITVRLLQALGAPDTIAGAAGAVMATEQALAAVVPVQSDPPLESASLTAAFPWAILAISRLTLEGTFVPTTYFDGFASRHREAEVAIFAIRVLEMYGNDADLFRLRELSLAEGTGEPAIQAIRAIERRAEASPRDA